MTKLYDEIYSRPKKGGKASVTKLHVYMCDGEKHFQLLLLARATKSHRPTAVMQCVS